uniref:Amyloid beta (A4) precursor protein-binding, family A, member 1b n=1 Tax=Astatotilapia calliptera TaxID=8154 RepID=A0AAX7USF1_ASTCA
MSHKYQGEATGEGSEEHKEVSGPPRSRQPNGTTGDPPARRSWRPCQMLNQDGELNPLHHHHPPPHHHHHHHHHHPPGGRGPPRHRRRPPSGQGQGQSQPLSPVSAPAAVSQDADPRPVQQPRAAVTRYRRHGDPNPRLRSHRQRQPFREVQDSSPGVEEREGPRQVQVQVQESSTADPVVDQSQDRESSHQTPIAVVTPTHLASGAAPREVQLDTHNAPPDDAEEDLQESKMECEQESDLKEDHRKQEKVGDEDGDHRPGEGHSGCGHDEKAEEYAERVEEDEERVMDNVEEDPSAQGSEITDLCSDTESAASLSMDGPLHSPPPLHSPTPPSSPDVPAFPQLDHFGEDASMSPLPDNDLPPEEEEDEDCSESCSLSHSTSCSESYPKTYADFYTESHQKSYSEPVYESYSESKPHPNSFPEPLKTSYPEPNREPRRQPPRQPETQAKTPPSGLSSSGEAQDEQNAEGAKGSGDAISLAIKDIKEAIEGVKTKTMRSPYTPDQPVEPIWVMRQEVSPTEDMYPLQTTAGHSSPHSPPESASESPSCYTSAPVRDPVSPLRVDHSSRAPNPQSYHTGQSQHNHHHHLHQQGHQSQQRDAARSPQTYTQPQPYPHMPPNQHQQCQHQQQQQQLPSQQPQTQAQQQSPPQKPSVQEIRRSLPQFPTFVDVPGPCDPEDLIDGIIFAATYMGCTHLLSERTPTKSARMQQAQEAMSRVRAAQKQAKNRKKSPDDEAPSTAEVDLFMSTQRIKVLNADTQECLMDLPLRTISYIADIGNMVVLMARGKMVRSRSAQENLDSTAEQTTITQDDRRLYRMICHVFESEDAQLIAQSIGQSFSVAYQEFLRANGIDPEDLSQREYSDLLNTQDMYNDDLIHFSKSENCRDVYIEKQKGEILGVVIVESGWGSILPTVIIASMMHAGPAEKSGRLNIGDQIMTINGTSLVGLPLSTCQSIIKGLKSQSRIKMNIVRCPPVTMVLIRRPDLRYQLGFSVQNGIICSLMRGGIAERGGVRVGHRIIEINSQSVVATPHEKIVQILSNAMGEIHMKTMPAAMYRLLTAQEQPVYI